jgi:hypothetical protein
MSDVDEKYPNLPGRLTEEDIVRRSEKEPPRGSEHDFRMTPTRISAKRVGASWIVYERRDGKDEILCFRGYWEDVYRAGTQILTVLDGRTVEQAEAAARAGGEAQDT